MKDITIIMPFLNEGNEPERTIESIYSTTTEEDKKRFEIIAIEDGSIQFLKSNIEKFPNVKILKNKTRIGVDGSRQLGMEQATTPYILVIDSHMRFKNDNWLEKAIDCASREPKTLWCTTCLCLGYGNMEISRSVDKYYGASILLLNNEIIDGRPATEILEPKWINKQTDGEYEIPCILGANYIFNKEWFNYIHGLKGLQMWGTSEPFLSLKSWMAGGNCKITTNIEIGHKFRKTAPYSTTIWNMIYNKLFLCKTIIPEYMSNKLIDLFPKGSNLEKAIQEIENQKEFIEIEKRYYSEILKIPIEEFCNRFNILMP